MSEAFSALASRSQDYADQQSLWFVDENYDVASQPQPIICTEAITNRIDIANYLEQFNGVNLSDYDCQKYADQSFDVIYLRVPKSKALLNHILLESLRLLKDNGRFICIGNNDEGIKNTFKKTEKAMGELVSQELLGKGLRLAEFAKIKPSVAAIEDRQYHAIKPIDNVLSLSLLSKAGIYSAEKIDQGSLFLCEVILEHKESLPETIVDLGCGNGLISLVLASTYSNSRFIATDNNITATALCAQNFTDNHVNGEVVLANCGETLASGQYDFIVSNPPFHQGFDTSETLTDLFLASTERLLTRKGEAWFVMNRFLKVEQLAKRTRLQLEMVSENNLFKVLRLKR